MFLYNHFSPALSTLTSHSLISITPSTFSFNVKIFTSLVLTNTEKIVKWCNKEKRNKFPPPQFALNKKKLFFSLITQSPPSLPHQPFPLYLTMNRNNNQMIIIMIVVVIIIMVQLPWKLHEIAFPFDSFTYKNEQHDDTNQ